ncbi:uncharacterized protein LOC105830470 isoform X1 [Monomorium pharaonis]|uniref:uncharacterized protein LOC105830470 isoform X1 n=1 Tax=Monomorium pharaonis TaxID=307658 RepID=UPI001746ABAE|nr:uncharacterized protein LOC105830470 isoform X1 [Monomorium pharaonis]
MNINHLQTEAILRVLRSHKCFRNLPKDSRTLLKTSRDRINFIPIGSGVYWHIGFVKPLEKHLSFYAANEIPPVLEIELNTDGLSLSKSNPMQYWPLQYRVINIPYFKPIIIGVYKGLDKPCNVYKFFENLLNEVKEANRLGGILIRNHHIPIVFKNFVADAPARALVLNHYGHNSSNPCSKCKVSGFRHENRTVYLGINHKKRTNEQYISCVDEDHQKGKSPLADLGIPIVTNVPFEIMHLVYLGVTMRLLSAWYDGKFGYAAKLRSSELNEMSSRYVELNKFCPNEFARRPRSLAKFSKFKATELRHFLLYAAPIISFGILSEEFYFHLLLLNVAMRIVTSNKYSKRQLKTAEKCLQMFVIHAEHLYTASFVSYNVHGLQHLVDDVTELGCLENCSAFVYENNMPLFKKSIRNHPRPLEQFANQLREKNYIQHAPERNPETHRLSAIHTNGPIPEFIKNTNFIQYKKYYSNKFNFAVDDCNSFCNIRDKYVCIIKNILTLNEDVFFVVQTFQNVTNFYELPIQSSSVEVYKCKELSKGLQLISINYVTAKCYSMPSWSSSFSSTKKSEKNNDEYIVSILLHYIK